MVLFNKISSRSIFQAIILLLFISVSCKKKKVPDENEPDKPFPKHEMLVNMADNLVIPHYSDFKSSFDSLITAYNTFAVSLSLADFQATKLKLNTATLKYQRISIFGFGPGEDQAVRANFNIFPPDTNLIKTNISTGTYNLGAVSNLAAKGLPAFDYLFYGLTKDENQQLQLFTSANRRKYVSDLLTEMSQKINALNSSWSAYRTTFINSLSTDISSSIGFLVNQLNYELDYLKNAKIATPLGLRSAGTPLPDNCEAFYSGRSMIYAVKTLEVIEDVYLGRGTNGSNGLGFDDYLEHLGSKHVNGSLHSAIVSQFSLCHGKLAAIGDPLSEKVITSPATVNDAYKELVKLIVLLKTDMPSSLGVVITYQDGDGD